MCKDTSSSLGKLFRVFANSLKTIPLLLYVLIDNISREILLLADDIQLCVVFGSQSDIINTFTIAFVISDEICTNLCLFVFGIRTHLNAFAWDKDCKAVTLKQNCDMRFTTKL